MNGILDILKDDNPNLSISSTKYMNWLKKKQLILNPEKTNLILI